MTPRDGANLVDSRAALVGCLLVASALVLGCAGGGGLATWPALGVQLLALAGVALVVLRGALQASQALLAGCALVGVLAASAAGSLHPFASLVQWAHWSAALALAFTVSRCLPLAGAGGPLLASRLALVAGGGVLLLQGLAVAGVVAGGRLGRLEASRPLGTFTDPNQLAAVLLLSTATCLRWAGTATVLARLQLVVAAVAGVSSVLTQSRVAPVALALIVALEAWRRRQGAALPRRALLAAGALVLCGGLVAAGIAVRRSDDADSWLRLSIWRAAAPAALEQPLLGLGPGAFGHAHQRYDFARPRGVTRFEKRVTSAHGEWLRWPIEAGFLGCLALFGLLAVLCVSAPVAARRATWPVAAAVVPLAAVNDILHAPAVASWTAVALAIACVPPPTAGRADVGARPVSVPLLPAALAAAVILAGAVVRPALADLAQSGQPGGAGLVRALDFADGQPHWWRRLAQGLAPEGTPLSPRSAALAEAALERSLRAAPRGTASARAAARLALRVATGLDASPASNALVAARYRHAAGLDPHDALLRVEAASVLEALGDPAGAGRFAREALEVEPACVAALALVVVTEEAQGRAGAAQEARRRLLEQLAQLRDVTPRSSYERSLLALDQQLKTRALTR